MKSTITFIIMVTLCTQLSAQTTAVFIDNSLSSSNDSTLLIKKADRLYNQLLNEVQEAGHKVYLAYLFENSSSISNQKIFTYDPPVFEPVSKKPRLIEVERINFDDELEIYHDEFVSEIVRAAFQYAPNRPATHILSTLPLLHELTKRNRTYTLYIVSDMLEVSAIRNLQASAFQNTQEAYNIGKADAERVRVSYGLSHQFLQGVKIQVLLPVREMDSRIILTWLPSYWQGVYTKLGLSSENLTFETL